MKDGKNALFSGLAAGLRGALTPVGKAIGDALIGGGQKGKTNASITGGVEVAPDIEKRIRECGGGDWVISDGSPKFVIKDKALKFILLGGRNPNKKDEEQKDSEEE